MVKVFSIVQFFAAKIFLLEFPFGSMLYFGSQQPLHKVLKPPQMKCVQIFNFHEGNLSLVALVSGVAVVHALSTLIGKEVKWPAFYVVITELELLRTNENPHE